MVHSEQEILEILKAKGKIRRIDGRHGDTFVNMTTLETMITQRIVKVTKLQGVEFVVAKGFRKNGH